MPAESSSTGQCARRAFPLRSAAEAAASRMTRLACVGCGVACVRTRGCVRSCRLKTSTATRPTPGGRAASLECCSRRRWSRPPRRACVSSMTPTCAIHFATSSLKSSSSVMAPGGAVLLVNSRRRGLRRAKHGTNERACAARTGYCRARSAPGSAHSLGAFHPGACLRKYGLC